MEWTNKVSKRTPILGFGGFDQDQFPKFATELGLFNIRLFRKDNTYFNAGANFDVDFAPVCRAVTELKHTRRKPMSMYERM